MKWPTNRQLNYTLIWLRADEEEEDGSIQVHSWKIDCEWVRDENGTPNNLLRFKGTAGLIKGHLPPWNKDDISLSLILSSWWVEWYPLCVFYALFAAYCNPFANPEIIAITHSLTYLFIFTPDTFRKRRSPSSPFSQTLATRILHWFL